MGQRSKADIHGVMPKAVHIEKQRRSMYSKVIGEKAVWSHVAPEAIRTDFGAYVICAAL